MNNGFLKNFGKIGCCGAGTTVLGDPVVAPVRLATLA